MYNELKALLEAGYEVSFRPLKSGLLELTVQEAKNGTVKGCDVKMNPLEWGLVEKGIAARLQEALSALKPTAKRAAKTTPKNRPQCQGTRWTPSTSLKTALNARAWAGRHPPH